MGVRLFRRQRWLCIWGLLALALQLAWAAGHVHIHHADNPSFVAAVEELGDLAGAGEDHDGPAEHQQNASHDCATCWTQSLAWALAVPLFPAILLPRPNENMAAAWQPGAPPVFAIPHGFQARAPPHFLSELHDS